MSDSNPFTITISAASPVASTVLGQAAASITAGQSCNLLTWSTPVPLSGFGSGGLAWQSRWHYDPIRKRCVLFSKGAGDDIGWAMSWYALSNDSGASANTWTVGFGSGTLNSAGHIYGWSDVDPATGDIYLWTGEAGIGVGNGSVNRWTATANGYTYLRHDFLASAGMSNGGAWPHGLGWHPNLFGTGIGGTIVQTADRGFQAYRASNNAKSQFGSTSGTAEYGQAVYRPGDGLYCYSRVANPAYRITTGPAAATIADNLPIDVLAGSAVTATVTCLLNHPVDATRLLLVVNNVSKTVYQSADGVTWSNTGWAHPFPSHDANNEGYVLCPISDLGVIWCITPTVSLLWKPPS